MNSLTDQFTDYRLITNEFTNRSVHLVQSSKSRLIVNELTNISIHYRVEKDKLTNRSVQSLYL
jgi:hypothetical protein